jgi:hypothetical protein
MEFKDYFKSELKRLNFTREMLAIRMGYSLPTLRSRVNNPGTFTIDEIKQLQDIGFNLDRLI